MKHAPTYHKDHNELLGPPYSQELDKFDMDRHCQFQDYKEVLRWRHLLLELNNRLLPSLNGH